MAGNNQPKYHPELDEILQCPVCFELPQGPIHQCDKGHHFCETCYNRVKIVECPLCKSQFYGTRNYLAEELVQKLPFLCIPDKPTPPDTPAPKSPILVKNSSTPELKFVSKPTKTPDFCRGMFPCQLRKCLKKFPAGRMLSHIRYHHSSLLSEVNSPEGIYKQVYQLDYVPNNSYETAIRVSSMGLFFLLLYMNDQADLKAVLLMLASEDVANTFSYKLKISDAGKHRKASYSNVVSSCRDNPLTSGEGGMCFVISSTELLNMCQIGSELQCYLTIENRNFIEEPLLSSASSTTSLAPVMAPAERSRRHRRRNRYFSSSYEM